MSRLAHTQTNQYEQTLLTIVRMLPQRRIEQLVDFAHFLEAQSLVETLTLQEDPAEIEADNAQWDTLLATDEAQMLLDKLADEAFTEHKAGKTRPMAFTHEGRIAPG
jgi:hypothetical protein